MKVWLHETTEEGQDPLEKRVLGMRLDIDEPTSRERVTITCPHYSGGSSLNYVMLVVSKKTYSFSAVRARSLFVRPDI